MANDLLMLIKLDSDTTAFLSLIFSIVGVVVGLVSAGAAITAASYARRAAVRIGLAPVEQDTQYPERASNRIYDIGTPLPPREEQEAPQDQAPTQAEMPILTRVEMPILTRVEMPILTRVETPIPTRAEIPTQAEAPTPTPTPIQIQVPTSVQTETPIPTLTEASTQVDAPTPTPIQTQAQAQPISISVEGEAMGEVPLELLLTVQDSSLRISRVERLGKTGKSLGSSPCKATDKALVFKSILAPEKVSQWWNAGASTSEGEASNILRVYLLPDESKKEVYRDIPVSIVEGLRNVGIATLVVWTIKGSI